MIDLYGLPLDFPGLADCRASADPLERVQCLESKFRTDIEDHRFIPYIQLHEFEALLFSDPDAFRSAFPYSSDAIRQIKYIRHEFSSPEHIDDGVQTAPSKRICSLLPNYAKITSGLVVAKEIGLDKMRSECSHFNNWIETLLGLAQS